MNCRMIPISASITTIRNRIAGRPCQNHVKFEMNIGASEEIVPPRRFGGVFNVFAQPFDITCSMRLGCGADDGRFDRDPRLRNLLSRDSSQGKHVLDAGYYGFPVGVVDECAPRRSLAQGNQARDFEGPKSFPKGVSRYAKLNCQFALRRQTIASPQSSLR